LSRYTRPAPLTEAHALEGFDSGTPPLDTWLAHRALRNQQSGASRTFVTCPVDDRVHVVGFYSLAASSVKLEEAPGKVRRNMPEPIPVILLGRLAVDTRIQGAGLGASLLQDAVRRVAGVADDVGIRALLVHAIDEPAAAFYRHFGFIPAPMDDQTLFVPIQNIKESLRQSLT
jgi:GNAT superfamily N-acetyltransferase